MTTSQLIFWSIYALIACYEIPFLIRAGWNSAQPNEKNVRHVCDVCFRDIKRFNAEVQKQLTQKINNIKEPEEPKNPTGPTKPA